MQQNQKKYIEDRSKEGVIQKEGGVLYQFGLGSMKKGSYDRYTPFDLNPDADFLVTGLGAPVGLVQASCNPYKADRELKGVDLGKIKDEVLLSFKPELEKVILPYKIIKKVSEKKATADSVGFTQKDMDAIYGSMPSFDTKTNTISAYDYLVANAGGHKCITTISGIGFVYSGYDKPYTKDLPAEAIPIAFYEGSNTFIQDIKQKLLRFRKLSEKQIQAAISGMKREGIDVESLANPKQGRGTTELTKDIRDKFVEILNQKIGSESKSINENKKANKPFIYRKQGKHDNLPGLNIKYLTPKEEITGYVNLLDYENSKLIDPDIPRFEKNSDKFCKCNCKKDHFNSKNTLYLYDLRVFDEHQGNGYSKKLMNKCHQISKDNGYKYVSLITDCDNTPAQNLYKKLGYKLYQTDGKKDFYFKEL
jgi:ribosomal protein S18 acetylase RimI-like enzyme